MKKIVAICTSTLALLFWLVTPTFAHVTVKPAEIGVGARANFAVSVPTEEDTPTTQVRLVIPEGLQSVRPNVKPGWNIELVKAGEGEEDRISEIIWSGGSIPAEQRDEFIFSAQAPAEETSLHWKAYQTYAGGIVVAWDNDPKVVEEYTKKHPPKEGTHDDSAPKPFSVTKVINDLAGSSESSSSQDTTTSTISYADMASNMQWFMILSGVAFVLSLVAIGMQMMRKR